MSPANKVLPKTTLLYARILVVDDELSFRRLMQRALTPSHYGVVTADSSKEALAQLKHNSFDLIILDVALGSHPDGLEFLQMLKNDPATKRIPVIMVTGHTRGEEWTRGLELGASDCLAKGFDINWFKAKIDSLIDEARKKGLLKHTQAQILYVEDEDEWGDLVKLWFGQVGITAQRVSGKKEMSSYLEQCKSLPECILMDLNLMDSDGLQLCDVIKTNAFLQRVPIVIFSSHVELRLPALHHKAIYFVMKSHGAQKELLMVLRSILSQQERTLGVIDLGDLRLDSRDRSVWHDSRPLTKLGSHLFAILRRLVERAPYTVADAELHQVAAERPLYQRDVPELRCRTINTYISQLRGKLGDAVGPRIQRTTDIGYVYFYCARYRQRNDTLHIHGVSGTNPAGDFRRGAVTSAPTLHSRTT